MKNRILLFAFAILANVTFGQNIIDKHYSNLEDREDATTIFVSQAMFEMASKLEIKSDDENFNQMQEFIHSVQSFNLVKAPGLDNPKGMFKSGLQKLDQTHTELIRIRDEGENFAVYVDEEDDVIYELAVIGVVEGDFMAASLLGEMDLDLISEFINKAQSDSFEGLNALKDIGVSEMKVYPNPSNRGSDFTVEVPTKLIGGKANVYDMEGVLVKTVSADKNSINIPTNEFTNGSFIVELVKDGSSIKKKMIIVD